MTSRLSLLTLAALLAAWGASSAGGDGDGGEAAPPEVRRVTLSADDVAAAMERVRAGELTELPLDEFDRLLRRAMEGARRPAGPRLIEARYRAVLRPGSGDAGKRRQAGEPSLAGTAEWRVANPGPGAAVLPLRPFTLAPHQPRFENQDALAGDFDGQGPGLLLEEKGRQTVVFDWTARGDQTPEGLHFDWRVPPSPLALLELELPAGREVVVTPDSCLVSGPHPADSPAKRLWTIRFANRSQLHLTVSREPAEGAEGGPPVVTELVQSLHHLAPEGETVEYAFRLKVLAPGLRKLHFACDPALRPYRVSLAGGAARLERWEYLPADGAGERAEVVLHLRGPVPADLRARIFCRGPLRPPEKAEEPDMPSEKVSWASRGMRLLLGGRAAWPRVEEVVIRCHPQLRLDGWEPGDFRPTAAETEADGTYKLTLAGTGIATVAGDGKGGGDAFPARPRLSLLTRGVSFRCRVLAWWQAKGAASTLTVHVGYEVRHGRLFELPVLISPGWEVERVWCPGSPERLRNWVARETSPRGLPGKWGGRPATLLVADLQPPVEPDAGSSETTPPPGPLPEAGRGRTTASPPSLLGKGAGGFGEATPVLAFRLRPSPRRRARTPEDNHSSPRWSFPFPVILPAGAEAVEGGLALDWDAELFTATFTAAAGAPPLPPRDTVPPAEGPWGKRSPRAYFPWRDQPPLAELRLRPRPNRLSAGIVNEVHLAPGWAAVETILSVRAESGAADAIDLWMSAPFPPGSGRAAWEVVEGPRPGALAAEGAGPPARAIGVRDVVRRAEAEVCSAAARLGVSHPLAAAGILTAAPAGEYRRLVLTRPLRAGESVTLRSRRQFPWPPAPPRVGPPSPDEGRTHWPLPLVTVRGAEVREGVVRVSLRGAEPGAEDVRATGLREAPGPATKAKAGWRPWRRFLHDGPFVGLAVRGLGPPGAAAPLPGPRAGGVIPSAVLRTRAGAEGASLHQYTFQVRNWVLPTLPVRLPPGGRLIAARVDGRDATGAVALSSDGEVELPVPVGPAVQRRIVARRPATRPPGGEEKNASAHIHTFEILYTTERAPWGLWAKLAAPLPVTPLRPLALRRVWRLPADFVPVGGLGLTPLPGGGTGRGGLGRWLTEPIPPLSTMLSRPLALNAGLAPQRQAIRAADARYRREAGGQEHTLGEALQRLAFEGLADQGVVLILDAAALREAGLHPGSRFVVAEADGPALAALAPLDLAYLPCPSAALLTTAGQGQTWQGPANAGRRPPGESPVLPASVAAAVAEAAAHGHDRSGRFQTVVDWLTTAAAAGPAASPLPSLFPADSPGAWADWEVTADVAEDAPLWVVRAGVPSAGGLALAGLLLLSAWLTRRSASGGRWREAGETPPSGSAPHPRHPVTGAAPRWPLALLLCWVGVASLGCVWLPKGLQDLAWWPLGAGVLVALVWYLAPLSPRRFRGRHGGRSSRSGIAVPAGTAVAGMLVLFWTARAAGPASEGTAPDAIAPRDGPRKAAVEVFLLPRQRDEGPASVLAPPDLLRRLGRDPAPPTLRGAALVGADYAGAVGTEADGRVEPRDSRTAYFRATFKVYCPGPGPARLVLPLDGVALRGEPLLDGARTRLEPLAGRAGYAVRIAGKGLHKIELSFIAPVTARDDGRAVQFSAPRAPRGRLTLRVPKGSRFLRATAKLGAQRVAADGDALVLAADLGAVTPTEADPRPPDAGPAAVPLRARWLIADDGKPVPVQFEETYLWDLGQKGHALTCLLNYRVGPGSVAGLSIDVPAGLLVSRLESRRPTAREDGGPAREGEPAGPIRLRGWRFSPGGEGHRRLNVSFQYPVSGSVQLLLVLRPSGPLFEPVARRGGRGGPGEARGMLPVPRPHGTPPPAGGYLAYRLHGLEAERANHALIVGLGDVREFPSSVQQAAGGGAPPDYACRTRREGEQGPELHLIVRPGPPRLRGEQRLAWRVGRSHADLRATLDLTSPGKDLCLVEWEVPRALRVTAVRGDGVRQWSQSSPPGAPSRVRVWLEQSAERVRLEWTGRAVPDPLSRRGRRWLPLGPALSFAARQVLARSALFDLPVIRVAGADGQSFKTIIELTAEDGMALATRGLRHLAPARQNGAPSGRRLSFVAERDGYAGRFTVTPARLPEAECTTTVEVIDQELRFFTRVELTGPAGDSWPVGVRLGNWRGAPVKVEAPGAAWRTEGPGAGAGLAWEVDWREGMAGPRVVTLSGRMPIQEALAAGGIPVPDVWLSGVARQSRRIVPGKGAAGFVPAFSSPPAGEGARVRPAGGGAWALEGVQGPASLVLRERAAPAAPAVQALLKENVVLVTAGGRRLRHTTWLLYHEAPAALTLLLPEGAEAVTVDGARQRTQERGGEIYLAGRGARRLSLWWGYPAGADPAGKLRLEAPRLKGVEEGPVAWMVHLPAGLRAADGPHLLSGKAGAARLHLSRARALLRLTELSLRAAAPPGPATKEGDTTEESLAEHQGDFAFHCRGAEYLLGLAGRGGADEERVREWRAELSALRERNRELMRSRGLGQLLDQAERRSWRQGEDEPRTADAAALGAFGESAAAWPGRPVYLFAEGGREITVLPLWSEAQQGRRRALAATGLAVFALLVVWLLSSFPAAGAARAFWPEQAVLLGLLGLHTFGPTAPVVFLLALGVAARGLALGAGLLDWLRRSRPRPLREL